MGLIRQPSRTPTKPASPQSATRPQAWEQVEEQPIPLTVGDAGVQGVPFTADIDVCELDEHQRPGSIWPARTALLSRSHIVLLSRRMSYVGRIMMVAIHLIDDEPTPLLGRVSVCEYHADSLYKVVLELLRITPGDAVHMWARGRDRR